MTQHIREEEPDPRLLYADIIHLPHWQSEKHPHMSPLARAAQFSAFNALAGYEDMVDEEAREVGSETGLGEAERELLNQKLSLIADKIEDGEHPLVTITYFVPDERKYGGSYENVTERVRRIDTVERKLELCRKTGLSGSYMTIGMDRIINIRGELVDYLE